ncbi:MAG: TonB-dependent receptor [Alphaproteobacteria bacterium]|nr:TonB-dependent receptor [Alphaproteobacteria bacterium]
MYVNIFVPRVLSTLPFLAYATSVFASQLPFQLPKIVVRATPLSEPNPLDSADTTRIPAKDLEQQQSVTISDALRRVPGVYVNQHGGIGQEARISIRGAGDGNTTVIMNGMTINDSGSFDNALNVSRWMASDLCEIEVIRGPKSSLYGPGGMGGVVLLETKKGQGAHKTLANTEAGSFKTYTQNVGFQGQKNRIDYYVNGSRVQSMGTRTTPSRYLTRIREKADNPLHQEAFTARLGATSDSAHISWVSRYLTRRLGFRQPPTDTYPYRQNFSESFNRLQGHFETLAGRWQHDFGLGHYQNNLINTRPTSSQTTRNGSQTQIDWRQNFEITNSLQLQVATDFAREKLYWYKLPILNRDFQTSHGGIGGTLSYRMYENLMLTGSSRIDKYQGISSKPTFRFGMQYRVKEITIKGGIGTAFKAPTLQQRFYKDPFFSGNPNLKPERSLGWDGGIERSFFQNTLSLGVTIFQNRIRDLITAASGGVMLINMDKARTQGVETSMRIHPTSQWSAQLSHTYTETWDERTRLGLIGNPLNKITFSVTGHVTSNWQLSGNVLYISSRDTFDAAIFKRVHTRSYTIVGLQTAYQLTDQVQFYGRAENLFNRYYESPRSFQQPGMGVYVGLRAQC